MLCESIIKGEQKVHFRMFDPQGKTLLLMLLSFFVGGSHLLTDSSPHWGRRRPQTPRRRPRPRPIHQGHQTTGMKYSHGLTAAPASCRHACIHDTEAIVQSKRRHPQQAIQRITSVRSSVLICRSQPIPVDLFTALPESCISKMMKTT